MTLTVMTCCSESFTASFYRLDRRSTALPRRDGRHGGRRARIGMSRRPSAPVPSGRQVRCRPLRMGSRARSGRERPRFMGLLMWIWMPLSGFIVTSTDTGSPSACLRALVSPSWMARYAIFPVPSSRSESCWMSIQVLMRMPAERASLIRTSNDGRVIDVCGAGASC